MVACLLAFLAAPAARADDSPLVRAEKLLADPAKAKEALDLLVKLPPEEKQTLDYHWLLATAHCAVGEVRDAAEALVTTAMLPPSPARSFDAVRKKLGESAAESFDLALKEQAAGNATAAVKAYLIATKLDPAMLGRDDKGLRELSLQALKQAVAKSPERADHQYRLGFYMYLFGRPEESAAPFEASVKHQTDPYLRWKNQLWLTRVQRELDEVRQQQAALKKKAKPVVQLRRSSSRDVDVEDTAKPDREREVYMRRRELEAQIREVDQLISEKENLKAGGGYTYNWKKVKANIQRLKEMKEKLEWELVQTK